MPLSIGANGNPWLIKGDLERRLGLMRDVEAAGLDHLFLADHVSFHNGLGMDGLINAATLTAMTPHLSVFVGVYLLALRHPVPVARQLASLAESAPGRIVLGIGIGGEDRHEMEICGVDPATRGRRTNHCLAALPGLLSGEPSSYDCEFFAWDNALIRPAPEPAIPFLVGGRSTAAIRRTARYGDGWLGVWCSPRRFDEATREVAEIAAAEGREVRFRHGLQVWVGLDPDRDKARSHVARQMEAMYQMPFAAFEKYSPYGSAEEVAAFLGEYQAAGAEFINVQACAASPESAVEQLGEVTRLLKAV